MGGKYILVGSKNVDNFRKTAFFRADMGIGIGEILHGWIWPDWGLLG